MASTYAIAHVEHRYPMSDHTKAAPAAQHATNATPVSPLSALGVAAAVTAFALIRVSANSASAWLGMVLGIGVALGAGLALGRWWPGASTDASNTGSRRGRREFDPASDTQATAQPEPAHGDSVSALHDEAHVFGADPQDVADQPAARAQLEISGEQDDDGEHSELVPDSDAVTPAEPMHYAEGHKIITPDMLINDDHPTVAMHIPAAQPVAIDDKPQSEALAAKDEVIQTLETIVKENRDRWADFDAERERMTNRIRDLEAELRVANDLIEHGTDQDEVAAVPQVLNQL